MISCDEAVRQLWEYFEDDLTTADRIRITDHLALCRRCCGEAEFTAALRDLLGSAAGSDLPPAVERDLTGFLATLEGEPS